LGGDNSSFDNDWRFLNEPYDNVITRRSNVVVFVPEGHTREEGSLETSILRGVIQYVKRDFPRSLMMLNCMLKPLGNIITKVATKTRCYI
jgi:hypothetical protein